MVDTAGDMSGGSNGGGGGNDDDVTIFDPGGRSVFWRSFSTGLFGAMVFVLVFLNA